MESVLIDIDPDKEEMVPRPDPTTETEAAADWILEEARSGLLEGYRGREASGIASVLATADSGGNAGVDADAAPAAVEEVGSTDVAADGGREGDGGGRNGSEADGTDGNSGDHRYEEGRE
jgi:flagellar protein FlaI